MTSLPPPPPHTQPYNQLFSIPTKEQNLFTTSNGFVPKMTKYPELYITPPPSLPNPHSFTFNSSVSMYPVDTMIPHLPAETSQKHELADSGASFEAAKGTASDFGNLFSGKQQDSDLSSLLSLLTNKEKEDPSLDFAIPSDLSSLFELLPDPQNLELTNPSLPKTEANMQTGIHLLPGPSKEQLGEPSKVPVSPEEDPFIAGVFGEDNFNFEPQESRLYNSGPSFDELLSQLGETSPVQSVHSPEQSPVASLLPSVSESDTSWPDNQLKELFEKTFDLETDYMLPPPAKQRHKDTPPYTTSPPDPYQHSWLSEPRKSPSPSLPSPSLPSPPVFSPHSPPEHKPVSLLPKPPVNAVDERGGSKTKKTNDNAVLFGKHESEIIHKLLIPQPGVASKPITRDKLVLMPVEEFNQLLEQAHLSEIEVAFMKEWRRRGKNKSAAQIARKRKRDELSDLDNEVEGLRRQKVELQLRYDRLRSEISTLKERALAAEDSVYQRYRKEHGTPVSRETHLIHVDGSKVMLVPRINSGILLVK